MSVSLPLRVLVVDDQDDLRLMLQALFEIDERFVVAGEARDGAEAVDRASELQPDIILLDAYMPGVSGLEALPELRAAAPDSRVVVFTADAQLRAEAFRLGAAGFITKETSVIALADALVDCLRGVAGASR